jgi:hypothetical protein
LTSYVGLELAIGSASLVGLPDVDFKVKNGKAKVNKAKDASEAIAALFGAKSIQALIKLQRAFKDKGYDISSLLNSGAP